MVERIHSEPTTIKGNNGVARATIPHGWQPITKLFVGSDAVRALLEGKHGIFYGLWVDGNQPSTDEFTEHEILEAIKDKTGERQP